jgi:hypothetical protein
LEQKPTPSEGGSGLYGSVFIALSFLAALRRLLS